MLMKPESKGAGGQDIGTGDYSRHVTHVNRYNHDMLCYTLGIVPARLTCIRHSTVSGSPRPALHYNLLPSHDVMESLCTFVLGRDEVKKPRSPKHRLKNSYHTGSNSSQRPGIFELCNQRYLRTGPVRGRRRQTVGVVGKAQLNELFQGIPVMKHLWKFLLDTPSLMLGKKPPSSEQL
eukprot:gene15194-biopygen4187